MPEVYAAAFLKWLGRSERWLALCAFLVLVLVVFADVLSRELTGAGLYWSSQTAVWANVLVVMAGFGLASADSSHLRPRFADGWLPHSWHAVLQTLQHVVMAGFSLTIAVLAARVTFGSWQLGEISIELLLPVWPVQAFLPLAFFGACLRHTIFACYPALRPVDTSAMAGLTVTARQ